MYKKTDEYSEEINNLYYRLINNVEKTISKIHKIANEKGIHSTDKGYCKEFECKIQLTQYGDTIVLERPDSHIKPTSYSSVHRQMVCLKFILNALTSPIDLASRSDEYKQFKNERLEFDAIVSQYNNLKNEIIKHLINNQEKLVIGFTRENINELNNSTKLFKQASKHYPRDITSLIGKYLTSLRGQYLYATFETTSTLPQEKNKKNTNTGNQQNNNVLSKNKNIVFSSQTSNNDVKKSLLENKAHENNNHLSEKRTSYHCSLI